MRAFACRGSSCRNTVQHRNHVPDFGSFKALRNEHDFAASVGVRPAIEPSRIVQEMSGALA